MNFRFIRSLFLISLAATANWPGWVKGQAVSEPAEFRESKNFLVQNWQTDQGLPRNTIRSLAQDHQGYLWMGTPQGLIRFDGVRFVAFEGEFSPAMARGAVEKIFPDHSGLWIATRRSGLFRIVNGSISSVECSDLSSSVTVNSMAQDSAGRLWLTRGDGLVGWLQAGNFAPTARLGNITHGPMLFSLTTDVSGNLWFAKQDTYGQLIDGQPTNWMTRAGSVMTLAPSRDGGLWVSTGYDLRRLKPGQAVAQTVVSALPSGPYGLTTLHEDREGTLWMGMVNQGLFCLKNGNLEKVSGISHTVMAILEDAEGNLWVGTDGEGLFKVRPLVFRVTSKKDGLPSESVVSVCNDWVAPSAGRLARMSPDGRAEMVESFKANGVTAVMDDGAGGFWAGTAGGQLFHQLENGELLSQRFWREGPQLRVLHRDAKGNLWLGGFPSGLFLLPAAENGRGQDLSWRGFTNRPVTAIAEDAAGSVWIGTSAGELFQSTGDVFRKCEAAAGFSGFPIVALLPGTNESLWIGTLGSGLGRLQQGKVQFLGDRAGLKDTVVTQLIQDRSGWMWIGTSRGICRVLTAELEAVLAGRKPKANAVQYGSADGLMNIECAAGYQPSAWLMPSGQIRFATSKGVVSFDPAAIPVNSRPPPLMLESVLVDGQPVAAAQELKLPHNYDKIEFRYTATSFTAPEKVRFKRRLSGFDEDWVEDGNVRHSSYPRLPPGRYGFQFTACNNDGVWNDAPYQFAFEVVPAFWQTAWFQVMVVITFAGLVGGGVLVAARMRMRRKLARLEQAHALERERQRISRDLHDNLGARATKISVLAAAASRSVELPETSRQLDDVSQSARQLVRALDETVWTVNPGNDSLANLLDYVTHYAEEFFSDTPVRCQLKIPVDVGDRPMAPELRHSLLAIIKESLNNVLKHSGARNVVVTAQIAGSRLAFTIQDDGCGFSPDAPVGGNGLANMRARAAAIGARIEIQSQPGQGTTLRVEVPALALGFVYPKETI